MRSGQLRHRVVIQSASATQGSTGEVTLSWSTATTRWASIEPMNGREYLDAMAARVEGTVRIRMRHYPALTTANRITWTDQAGTAHTFEINDVQHLQERAIETHAICREAA